MHLPLSSYLFASLVTSTNFPQLRSVKLKEHKVADATLAYICDALLVLPTLENLEFSSLQLSNRGANLLLSAVSEISSRLKTVNGIPLAKLLDEKKGRLGADDGSAKFKGALLAGDIVWNDFSLGLLSRLKLWNYIVWPESDDRFVMEGYTITDVGVRGLCGLLKCFSPTDNLPMARTLPNITEIDLSRNAQLTDAAVAVLCKALTGINSLPSLARLTVRYCPKLKARSML